MIELDDVGERLHRDLLRKLGAKYVGFTGERYYDDYGFRPIARPLKYLKWAVVHHTAGNPRHTGRDLAQWFRNLGWDNVGYNIVVRPSGEVELLLPPSFMSYGAGSAFNWTTMHVACIGNYHPGRRLVNGEWTSVSPQPSIAMLDSLYKTLCSIDDSVRYMSWRCHRELKATACPGDNLVPHVKRMRGVRWGAAPSVGRKRPTSYPA